MNLVQLFKVNADSSLSVVSSYQNLTFDCQADFRQGTIQFSLDNASATSLGIKAGTLLRIKVDNNFIKESFYVESRGSDFVSEDGVASRQFKGRSSHVIFEDDVVLPSAWPSSSPSGHSFQNSTPGNMIKTLVLRAQERGTLVGVTTNSFNGTSDSNGAAWPSMMDRSFNAGDSILSVIQGLVDQGQVEAEMVGLDLRLYKPGTLGRDIPASEFVLRAAQNLAEGTSEEDSTEFATDIYAVGEGVAVAQKTRPSAYNVLGRRRVRFANYGGIADAPLLGVLADSELDMYTHIKREDSISIAHTILSPFENYRIGDWVYLAREVGSPPEQVQIKQISVQVDNKGEISVGVSLGDLLDSADTKLKRRLDAITGTNAGGGAIPSDKTQDKQPPAAPVSVGVTSLSYLDSSTQRKVAALIDWSDVSANANGTPANDIAGYEFRYRSTRSLASGDPTLLTPAKPFNLLDSVFDRRNKSYGVVSGSSASSIRLSDGRDLWFFGSVQLGVVDGAGSLVGTSSKVANAVVRINPTPATPPADAISPAYPDSATRSRLDRRGFSNVKGWIGGDNCSSVRVGGKDWFFWADTIWGNTDVAGKVTGWRMPHNTITISDPNKTSSALGTITATDNLLSAAAARCETSSAWTANNATIAADTAWKHGGVGSLKITRTTVGTMSANVVLSSASVGQTWVGSVQFDPAVATATTHQVRVRFLDSSSNVLSEHTSNKLNQGRASVVTPAAPANASKVELSVWSAVPGAVGDTVSFTKASLSQNTHAASTWRYSDSSQSPGDNAAGWPLEATSLVTAVDAGGDIDEYLWAADSFVLGASAYCFYHGFKTQGTGDFNYAATGRTYLAQWDYSSRSLERFETVSSSTTLWGNAVRVDGPHVYVFGQKDKQDGFGTRQNYLSRVSASDPYGSRSYWDGTGWVPDNPGDAVSLVETPAEITGVRRVGTTWWGLYASPFSNNMYAAKADDITGPWTTGTVVYTYPEDSTTVSSYKYIPRFHPALDSSGGGYSFSYCQNGSALLDNILRYVPVFVKTDVLRPTYETLSGKPNLLPLNLADPGAGGTAADYWTFTNCTGGYNNGWANYGTQSLRLTSTTTASPYADANKDAALVAVVEGQKITLGASFKAAAVARNVRVSAVWLKADKTALSTTDGVWVSGSTATAGVDVREAFTVPFDAAYVAVRVQVGVPASTANEVHYVDRVFAYSGERLYQSWSLPAAATDVAVVSPSAFGIVPSTGLSMNDCWMKPGDSWTANGKIFLAFAYVERSSVKPGTYVAQWDAATLKLDKTFNLSTGNIVATDASVVDGAYAYLFGRTSSSTSKQYLVRVSASDPTSSAANYWSGSAWVASSTSAAAVTSFPLTGVRKIGTTFTGIYIAESSQYIKRMTASSITGPWANDSTTQYTAPEKDSATTVDSPRYHPQFDTAKGLVYGYNITTTRGTGRAMPKLLAGPTGALTAENIGAAEWSGILSAEESKATVSGFEPNTAIQVEVRTKDTSGLVSPDPWTRSGVVVLSGGAPGSTLVSPSTPIVEALFQGIRVTWDGLDSNGGYASAEWAGVEVHVSDLGENFFTSNQTRVDMLPIMGAGLGGVSPVTGLKAGTAYWVKLVAVGKDGGASKASRSALITTGQLISTDLAPRLIEAAHIAEGAISVENLNVAAFSEQLIPNGDFENSFVDGVPYGWWGGYWQGDAQTFPTVVTGSDALSGTKSWRHTIRPGNGRQYCSPIISVVGGDIYYFSAVVKSSRPLAGGVKVQMFSSAGGTQNDLLQFPPLTAIGDSISAVVGGSTAQKVEGQLVVPANHKFACVSLSLYSDSGATTDVAVTLDDVQIKRVVGTANIANAAINNAKIADLSVDNAKIANMKVDKLLAGILNSDITVSARIKTSDTGQRVEINASGLQGYNASNQLVTEVRTDGGLVSRFFRTNTSGTRMEMGTYSPTAGSALISFYPDAVAWLYPPALGFGGGYAANWVPGIAIYAGTRSQTNYDKYGLSMIGLDDTSGITLTTGNKLNNTTASEGTDIRIAAGGAKGRIQLYTTGSSPSQMTLSAVRGASNIALYVGTIYMGTVGDNDHAMKLFEGTYAQYGGTFLQIREKNGILFQTDWSSTDTAWKDSFRILKNSLIQGATTWTAPMISTRHSTNNTYMSWDNSGNAYRGTAGSTADATAVKTFVIDHPLHEDKYLVHATNEMPEARVEYSGNGKLEPAERAYGPAGPNSVAGYATQGDNDVEITLPDYFTALVDEETAVVLVTPYYDTCGPECKYKSAPSLAATRVKNGKFRVKAVAGMYHPCAEFGWRVSAVRKDVPQFEVEPDKNSGVRKGDGPYSYFVPGSEQNNK